MKETLFKHLHTVISIKLHPLNRRRIRTNGGHCSTTKLHKIPHSGAHTDTEDHRYLTPKIKDHFQTSSLQHHSKIPLLPLLSPLPHREEEMETISHKPTQNVYPNDSVGGDPSADQGFKKPEHERRSNGGCYSSA